jgi:hypothetical protein
VRRLRRIEDLRRSSGETHACSLDGCSGGDDKALWRVRPIYEVLGLAPRSERGEMVAIRVIHSGEELDYLMAHMLADPVAV